MLFISRERYGKLNPNFYILTGIIAIILVQNATADEAPVKSDPASIDSKKSSPKESKSKAIIVIAKKSSSSDTDKPNWYDWAGVPENSTNWLPTPRTTPLTTQEQEKRIVAQMHRAKVTQSVSGPLTPHPQPSHYTKGAKKQKKPLKSSGSSPLNFEEFKIDDIRGRMMSYGKMLFDYMGISNLEDLLPSGSEQFGQLHVEEGKASSGGWNSQQYHYSSHSGDKSEGKSLLKWLSRLIGIEGKSLGEFLREYQVHVLYDLVFTFFKWIFFLYAGLLIP